MGRIELPENKWICFKALDIIILIIIFIIRLFCAVINCLLLSFQATFRFMAGPLASSDYINLDDDWFRPTRIKVIKKMIYVLVIKAILDFCES